MIRKICVVTGTRAEYGLLRWVMQEIQESPDLELQIIATNMHLSPEYGLTFQQIEADGFRIDWKIEMLLSSDTAVGITKSTGLGIIGFADAFQHLRPDTVLVLGDRYEIFAAVTSAMIACIPVAHLHGGELTEGLIDEALRHSITKMSHLHFVAAEVYRKRVIQLGEQPDNVFVVGGLGIDNIVRLKLLERQALEHALDIKFAEKNLMITFHPVTLENASAGHQVSELLEALEELEDTQLIFTLPNAEANSHEIITLIKKFETRHNNAKAFTSLGQLKYLSCLKWVDGVIGNSSSGLIEAPSFYKGTINIGDRQRGRLKAASIIDCEPNKQSILEAIKILYSRNFQSKLLDVKNPYGNGGASKAIVKQLCAMSVSGILKKQFYDIPSICE